MGFINNVATPQTERFMSSAGFGPS
jgi:hypothetical protein